MKGVKNISSGLYKLIPTLLEMDDVVCGEFKIMFKKLIVDLITDINNINNKEAMLYEKNIHNLNAINVIRAFNACIQCLINKINGYEPLSKECTEKPEENEETYTEPNNIISVLQETFNINKQPKDEETDNTISSDVSESPQSFGSTIPDNIPREISVPRKIRTPSTTR